jgi:hypothetical protein
MSRLRPHRASGMVAALAIIAAPIAGIAMPSSAPAPRVLAWASFLGPDGAITTTTPWSSGELWQPVSGDWAQVGHALVSTRSMPDTRVLAAVPTAGSGARVAAIVSSLDGSPVRDGGVIAASSAAGTRRALIARVTSTGALEVVYLPGRPVSLGSSAAGAVTEASIELTLQMQGSTVVATARPLWSRDPTVTVTAALSPAQVTDLVDNDGYGGYADQTTGVAITALRVEVPA